MSIGSFRALELTTSKKWEVWHHHGHATNGRCLHSADEAVLSSAPKWNLRNEDVLADAVRDQFLHDARAFEPELDDDQDTDNDIGVSFVRWPVVVHLVDSQPYRAGAAIPFITFGLRGVHIGRRDFICIS